MMQKIYTSLLIVVAVAMLAACGSDPVPETEKTAGYEPMETVQAELTVLPRLFDAVGTVKAKTDVRVEAQVTGRVRSVLVRPGDKVKEGQDLVVLNSEASKARLDRSRQAQGAVESLTRQARDGLAAAKAAYDKARTTYERMSKLHDQRVVTAEEVEKAESAYLQAKAGLGQAEQGVAAAEGRAREAAKVVQEAKIDVGYTTIKAQADGEVAKRLAEPGDLAFPGKELLTLLTGGSLQLEALVRESLITRVHLGDELGVEVTAMGDEVLSGVVEEIEPLADPVTRSFLVKVRLDEMPGLYPGMFGRLMVPLGEEETVLIPDRAVVRVGQLETVMVKVGTVWQSVYIRTGKRVGDRVEVLSGLSGGETVGIGRVVGGEQ